MKYVLLTCLLIGLGVQRAAAQDASVSATDYYIHALQVMKAIPEPALVTFQTRAMSDGLGVAVVGDPQHHAEIQLSLGGNSTDTTWASAYRASDDLGAQDRQRRGAHIPKPVL